MILKKALSKGISLNNANTRETSNFIIFSLGKLVSIFGSSIYTFAIGLYILRETGSGLSFATTLAIGIIPIVLISPFAGVIADKFDKKKVVVSMDMLNGVLLLGLYLISSLYGLSILMINITLFIMTVFTCFFGISIEAAKPNIVSGKMLMNINSVSKIIDSVSSILGPMVGGMVFAFIDIKAFILMNGISFVFSSISEMFMDFHFNNEGNKIKIKTEEKINFIKDVKEGFKYVKGRKDITNILSIFVALNFFLGFAISVPLPFIINNVLKLSSTQFGIIESGFPVGMIIGALVIKRVLEKIQYNKLLIRVSLVLSLCMLLIGIPILFINMNFNSFVYLVYYCSTIVIFGVALSFVDIPVMYIFQTIIPEEYRGRVISIAISIAKTILPLALIISGTLINRIPVYMLPISGGILLWIVMFSALKGSNVKDEAIQQ
jgi:MFS family permease